MALYIDNVLMPCPLHNSITHSAEKVWSENTARSKSAKMNGTIIEVKKTLSLPFPPLTKSQKDKLEAAVSTDEEWHTVKLTDAAGNTIEMFECYFGTATYTIYSGAAKCRYYLNYKVDAIER